MCDFRRRKAATEPTRHVCENRVSIRRAPKNVLSSYPHRAERTSRTGAAIGKVIREQRAANMQSGQRIQEKNAPGGGFSSFRTPRHAGTYLADQSRSSRMSCRKSLVA